MEKLDLFSAVREGSLQGLPQDALSSASLTRPNAAGHTPLHAMAKHGLLRELPAGLLNLDLVGLRNHSGYSVLHMAALGGHQVGS